MDYILATVIYWSSLFAVLHTWCLYGLILFFITRIRTPGSRENFPEDPPFVSIIIAAKDEERNIRQRLENIRSLDYDPKKMEVIVASDGSTDSTNEIVLQKAQEWERLRLLQFKKQKGRAAVHNEAAKVSKGEVLVFTDAETRFHHDFLKVALAHFSDPSVGAVSGRIYYINEENSAITVSASLYWRMEERLRLWESQLGWLAFGSGAAFCVRKDLYSALAAYEDIDYALSLDVAARGYKVVYEPRALAYDVISTTVPEAHKARVRQTSKAFRSILRRIFSTSGLWRRPQVVFATLSHKIMRHLTPLALLGLLVGNMMLLQRGSIYKITMIIQALFYMAALIGWVGHSLGLRPGVLSLPFTFVVLNFSRMWGLLRGIIRPPQMYR
jgi:cellulose synthase/poly-beta-1,6-N-acetylglucosamine synthase-like glycosyltransferase